MFFFFQAEDGIRDLVRSRGLGDVYKRQVERKNVSIVILDSQGVTEVMRWNLNDAWPAEWNGALLDACLLYTSDAADERSSVDLGGRRIIKKKKFTCTAMGFPC